MSDGAHLVLVIAVLFAMESFASVPDGAAVFVSGWLRRYTAHLTGGLLRAARGRLLVLHPLVASSHHLVAGLPALALDADGIADCGPEDFDVRTRRPFVRWDVVGRVARDGRHISADGLGVVDCGTERAARVWARVLNELRRTPRARRQELARRWTRMRCSPALVRRRLERVQAACARLEIVTDGAWLLLIASGAALVWLGQPRLVPVVLGIGELAGLVTLALFWRAHARLHPRARGERWGKAAVMAVCFPIALRARSQLARDAASVAHPAAVAAALLARPRAVEFLRALALRWAHRLRLGDAGAGDVDATLVPDALKTLAKELGVAWPELLAPPVATDASLKTYCPRCRSTYVLAGGTCADCPGVTLVRLSSADGEP